MLRLRPSELTLTSDDVEETFRRIALRQATRPQSSLPRRPLGQPGRPILRHGPQRATRDALTALGKIPLLQPQQALVTSVNEDGGNTSACEDISSSIDPDSSNNHHADPTTLDHERQDEPVPFPASSASHTVQLPIRARRESAAQSPANDTPSNVPRTPQRQISTSPTSGSADMSGDYSLSAADSTPGLRGGGSGKRSGDPSKSPNHPPETLFLRGYFRSTPTGDVYNFHESWQSEPRQRSGREVPAIRSRSAGHLDNTFGMQQPTIVTGPNPFSSETHMRPLGSNSRTSGPTSQSPFENVFRTQPPQPTIVTGPNPFSPGAPMGSLEYVPPGTSMPTNHIPFMNTFRTQPQQPTIVTSHSPFVPGSYMGPSASSPSQTSGPASHDPSGNIFSTQPLQPTIVPGPNPFGPEAHTAFLESVRKDRRPIPSDSRSLNTRQTIASSSHPSRTRTTLGSETSATSAAYSYYGSLPPESRSTSSENPTSYNSPYSHVDGTAVAHESIQPSFPTQPSREIDTPAPWESGPIATGTSPFSPYLTHRPSPLPASPYTRTQHNHRDPSPSHTYARNPQRGFMDAATAASQNLPSPLDPMADQYQRRMHATTNRRIEDARAITPSSRPQSSQARRSSQSRNPSHNPHLPPRARNPGFNQPQYNMAGYGLSPYAATRLPISPYAMPAHGSVMPPPRSAHISSENAPAHQSRATRTNTVQEHRAAYERLQAANRTTPTDAARSTGIPPFRHSMPQPSIADDRPNRPRSNALHNPATADQPQQRTEERPYSRTSHNWRRQSPEQVQLGSNANAADLTPNFANPQPHRHHGSEPPPRPPTRAYRPGPGATHLQPTRDGPLTALAPDQGTGTTSRRTRSPILRGTTTARTHRRIPPEQRDQENNGDRAIMRREESNINARYAEDEQQMNETPPRTGPVERRLHE